MDDWITNYYDVPASCDSIALDTLVEGNSNPVTDDQKSSIECCNFKYQAENFSSNANTKIDLAAA